jgi:hypothetical protein
MSEQGSPDSLFTLLSRSEAEGQTDSPLEEGDEVIVFSPRSLADALDQLNTATPAAISDDDDTSFGLTRLFTETELPPSTQPVKPQSMSTPAPTVTIGDEDFEVRTTPKTSIQGATTLYPKASRDALKASDKLNDLLIRLRNRS